MRRFVEGLDRGQSTLFPERLEDWIGEDNAVRVIDVFVEEPTPKDNPLLTLPNFIAAPHVAGVTREAVDRMAIVAVQNILSVLDGKPNRENVINRDVLG